MKAKTVLVAAAFSLTVLALFAGSNLSFGAAAEDERNAARAAAEDDIRETVFRYQMEKQKVPAYFLRVENKDPSPEFLKRFAGNEPPVKPASAADLSPQVKDKETGTKGVILGSDKITWVNDNEVKVEGSEYHAPLAATGWTFTVTRQRDKWVVTGSKMEWIS